MTATTSTHNADPLDEMVDTLVAMMGDADRDFARKVLKYYNGDGDKAADALLGGEAHTLNLSAPPGNLEGYVDYAPPPRQSVLSLSGLSMTYSSFSVQSEQGCRGSDEGRQSTTEAGVGIGSLKRTRFSVSRDAGCTLAYLVPQVPVDHGTGSTMDVDVVQDEQLNKAIAESLAMSTTADEVDDLIPPEELVRRDDR